MSVGAETEAYQAYLEGARRARLLADESPWDDALERRARELEADRDHAHARLMSVFYGVAS